jgi:hypothetical protein
MTNATTDSVFVRRLSAAAGAGWWTLLIGAIVLTVQFFGYTAATRCQAFWSWELGLMGTDAATVHQMVLWYVGMLKMFLLVWLLGCVFLTLWVRRLRRAGDA